VTPAGVARGPALADERGGAGQAVTVGPLTAPRDNLGHRPLLRGWFHVMAFAAWLVGGPFLIAAAPDGGSRAALIVYVLAMLCMFGVSALFHRVRWTATGWRRMRRADHSAIFIGIAGTSTGVAGLALNGWSQALMLSLVWAGAGAGIVLRQVWLDAPQWAVAIPYVVVGWCSLAVAPQLVRSLGGAGFALMLVAGLAYTAGALVYARKRPDPWPGVFGFHEVFHACTVAAFACQYVAVWIVAGRAA
jgi:hemolysin III